MLSLLLTSLLPTVAALGGQQCLYFTSSSDHFSIADHGSLVPIITDSTDPEALHVAASTFADDLERVTGSRPAVCNDTVPDWADRVIMVGTASSPLVSSRDGSNAISGKWEAYDIRVASSPVDGVSEALIVTGSDKVCKQRLGSCLGYDADSTARGHLWSIRTVGTNGGFTLVLVVRCPCRSSRCRHLPEISCVRSRRANSQVPRTIHQR